MFTTAATIAISSVLVGGSQADLTLGELEIISNPGSVDVIITRCEKVNGRYQIEVDYPQSSSGPQQLIDLVIRALAPIDIEYIEIGGGNDGDAVVELSVVGTDAQGNDLVQSIGRIQNTNPGPGRELWLDNILVAGDVGEFIEIHDLETVIIGGDFGGMSVTDASDATPLGRFRGGNIDDLIIEGNVTGDIIAIGNLFQQVPELDGQGIMRGVFIGGNMTDGDLKAREEINNVEIDGRFEGDVLTGFNPNGAFPLPEVGITRLIIGAETTSSYVGTLMTKAVLDEIVVSGNLQNATLDIADPIAAGAEIRVGGFMTLSTINLPADGLQGEIILRNNTGAASGANEGFFNSAINFGPMGSSVEIDMADYERFASDFGGGTLAVAPWLIFDQQSQPVSGFADLDGEQNAPAFSEVTTAYYAPVELDPGAGELFTVKRKYITTNTALDNAEDFDFEDVPGSFNITAQGGDRIFEYTATSGPGFAWGYEYLITPGTGMKSAGTLNEPPPTPHSFTIAFDCPTNISGFAVESSGLVTDNVDLAVLLAAWGSTGQSRSDINEDGVVDSGDLALMLAAWGPCGDPPPSAAMAGPAGSSFGGTSADAAMGGETRQAVASVSNPVLEHFGFSSVESYTAWLDSLSETQMDAHLRELIEFVRESE